MVVPCGVPPLLGPPPLPPIWAPWKNYPFLRMSCKAFSLLKKPAPVPVPKHKLLPQPPPRQSTLFWDAHQNAYFSLSLIRSGVTTIRHLLLQRGCLPRTWTLVFDSGLSQLVQPASSRRNPGGQPHLLD